MFAYLEGVPGGSGLEKLVKDYKKRFVHIEEFQNINPDFDLFVSQCSYKFCKIFFGRFVKWSVTYLLLKVECYML